MTGITKLGWMALVLAALIVVADQATKAWILTGLDLPQLATLKVAGPFYLTMVWNPGVSFGFLQAQHDLVRWALAAFSIAVAIVLAVWVRRSERPLFAVAVGMVMGGAVGNVIDRIRFGAVADFVDVSRLHFPWVFNLADSAITIGICLLLLDMLRQDSRERSERTAKTMGEDAA
ncbi:MAG: lspA [Phenylobacterium sp.]|uniref:signal peptidase II n=1 Tax=Phenylobacterium sp. TaxID=1871053 RepID=UPI002614F38A|nr:signal peptidase II [Phenylobacterium sp.]MDB5463044.1 lspA [Phenylobacterium sp.]MDB5498499.1 lspA [Phenylobacterium sp.]